MPIPGSSVQSKPAPPTDWSDIELAAATAAYLAMLRDELEGRPYVKAAVNRQLREGPLGKRTRASIEFRMQNISATLAGLGRPFIAGYLPAKNVGNSVKARILASLEQNGLASLPFSPTADPKTLELKVTILRQRVLDKPVGIRAPDKIQTSVSTFVRDPLVKAWVLQAANGVCEGCGSPAPFISAGGFPYLEVHHVRPLSHNGSDQTSNAVALCPNCHRRCHIGEDRAAFTEMLYASVSRLLPEHNGEDDPSMFEFVNQE